MQIGYIWIRTTIYVWYVVANTVTTSDSQKWRRSFEQLSLGDFLYDTKVEFVSTFSSSSQGNQYQTKLIRDKQSRAGCGPRFASFITLSQAINSHISCYLHHKTIFKKKIIITDLLKLYDYKQFCYLNVQFSSTSVLLWQHILGNVAC